MLIKKDGWEGNTHKVRFKPVVQLAQLGSWFILSLAHDLLFNMSITSDSERYKAHYIKHKAIHSLSNTFVQIEYLRPKFFIFLIPKKHQSRYETFIINMCPFVYNQPR